MGFKKIGRDIDYLCDSCDALCMPATATATGTVFGYASVSTGRQSLDRRLDVLTAAVANGVFHFKVRSIIRAEARRRLVVRCRAAIVRLLRR